MCLQKRVNDSISQNVSNCRVMFQSFPSSSPPWCSSNNYLMWLANVRKMPSTVKTFIKWRQSSCGINKQRDCLHANVLLTYSCWQCACMCVYVLPRWWTLLAFCLLELPQGSKPPLLTKRFSLENVCLKKPKLRLKKKNNRNTRRTHLIIIPRNRICIQSRLDASSCDFTLRNVISTTKAHF